jgi:hypothetical protein
VLLPWREANTLPGCFQPGDGQSWKVELLVEDGGIAISYPGLSDVGCSGDWQLVGKKKGVFHFRETITEGTCDPVVEVYITRVSDNAISVAYYVPEIMENVVAHTVLERE